MNTRGLIAIILSFMMLMLPVAFAQSVTNYTYDANGNMVNDSEFTYAYNTANQMIEVRNTSNGLVEQYFYDHRGNRVKKFEKTTDGGNRATYYVSSIYEVELVNGTKTVNTSYYYANGERISRKETNSTDSEVYYYHSDHLQSTSVVTRKGWLFANTTSTDNSWLDVSLNESLIRPVVVAKIQSENNDNNSALRMDNVSCNSQNLIVL